MYKIHGSLSPPGTWFIMVRNSGSPCDRNDGSACHRESGSLLTEICTAFVLQYRLPAGNDTIPLNDARAALKYVRDNCKKYGVNPEKVGILGFSAGGHLASTAGTHFRNPSERPDFLVLVYPVISFADSLTHVWSRSNLLGQNISAEKIAEYSNELRVTDSSPPVYLVHAMDDEGVKVENSLYFEAALRQHHIPCDIFLYARGGHAFGLKNKLYNVQWTDDCVDWIKNRLFKK